MFQFKVESWRRKKFTYNLIDTNIELFRIISIISISIAEIIKQHIREKESFKWILKQISFSF